jgi:hypothetical protein
MTSVTNDVSVGRQALRRSVNERISGLSLGSNAETVEVFCECGRRRCADRIRIATDVYEQVRTSVACFVVTAGHEESEAELIARNNGYLVVERKARP